MLHLPAGGVSDDESAAATDPSTNALRLKVSPAREESLFSITNIPPDGSSAVIRQLDASGRDDVWGLPLMRVDREERAPGSEPLDYQSGQFTLKSSYLKPLADAVSTNRLSVPAFELQVDYDVKTGEYGLNKWGVGLFRERLWLMYELPETEGERGTYGVHLKSRW